MINRSHLIIPSLISLILGCSKSGWKEGGLYYSKNDDGSYMVLKILKIDEQGVHVRLYSNRFASPAKGLDESKLYMAGVDHKPDESLGMGHAPFSKSTFENSHPIFIKVVGVKPEELEGYNMWLEAKGGYF
jgi:hypothetical protein